MAAMVDAEARGESFWTPAFGDRVRVRIRRLLYSGDIGPGDSMFYRARAMILDQEGTDFLYGHDLGGAEDFDEALRHGPHEFLPTLVEALVVEYRKWESRNFPGSDLPRTASFIEKVNEVFEQERVAWRLIDGEMVEMRSQELHESVVEPAMRLLHQARFANVDAVYRKALDELSKGDAADAVTDAGTALQEMLKSLGCRGNQLGDLIRSAKSKGLLGAHDTPLFETFEKAMHWVAADRSEKGESHHLSDATLDDAWLIVHVVGAFIVRLASDEGRGSPSSP